MNQSEIIRHYDRLVELGDDPVWDPPALRGHMDAWDGARFIDSMELDSTKSLLEIGVGTGRLAVRVAPRCGSFTGIDLSPKAIGRAAQNLRKLCAQCDVRLICGDFVTCEPGGRYDVIYSSLTFMHIEDKALAVRRAASLLAGGGRFVLSLDKDRRRVIDTGESKITVFPDDPEAMAAYIAEAGLVMLDRYETEFAHILVSGKKSDRSII